MAVLPYLRHAAYGSAGLLFLVYCFMSWKIQTGICPLLHAQYWAHSGLGPLSTGTWTRHSLQPQELLKEHAYVAGEHPFGDKGSLEVSPDTSFLSIATNAYHDISVMPSLARSLTASFKQCHWLTSCQILHVSSTSLAEVPSILRKSAWFSQCAGPQVDRTCKHGMPATDVKTAAKGGA